MFSKAKLQVVAILGLMLASVGAAQAEVPASVTTALTGATTDVGTIGAAVFAIAVAIMLFKWFRRAL